MSSPDETVVAPEQPVCPRHPGVVSYVRCQRCERPVCPVCQRPAAVGVQCVDCVAAAAKSVRSPRTVFGGTLASDTRPVVTIGLIGLCVAAFVAQQAGSEVTGDWAFSPVVGWSEPWRFLTAAFLHGSPLHLLFNMWSLWLMGGYLEPMLGRARYLALYLISALGGSVGVVLLANAPTGDLFNASPGDFDAWLSAYVGASGAVFGLFAAVLVLNRHLGRDSSAMLAVVGINLVYGFLVPNVAWQAHIGGLVTGTLAAAALAWTTAPARRRFAWPALTAVLAVLLAVAMIRYGGVPAGFK